MICVTCLLLNPDMYCGGVCLLSGSCMIGCVVGKSKICRFLIAMCDVSVQCKCKGELAFSVAFLRMSR